MKEFIKVLLVMGVIFLALVHIVVLIAEINKGWFIPYRLIYLDLIVWVGLSIHWLTYAKKLGKLTRWETIRDYVLSIPVMVMIYVITTPFVIVGYVKELIKRRK